MRLFIKRWAIKYIILEGLFVRTIQAEQITQEVAQMCKEAAYYIPGDVYAALEKARLSEKSPVGRDVL